MRSILKRFLFAFVSSVVLGSFNASSMVMAEELYGGSLDEITQDYVGEHVQETLTDFTDNHILSSGERAETKEDSLKRGVLPVESRASVNYCPSSFYYSKGVGMRGIQMTIKEDWSFVVDFHDTDLINGEGYNYTTWFARVFGQFHEPIQLNEYSYSFPVVSATPQYEPGYEYIEGEARYVVISSEGLVDTDQFILYLPGTPVSIFSKDDRFWVDRFGDTGSGAIGDSSFILKNPGTGMIFGGRISADSERISLPTSTIPISDYTPPKAAITGLREMSIGKIRMQAANKGTAVDGYQFKWSLDSSFNTGVKSASSTKHFIFRSGLIGGKTYYVKARTYKVINGKKVYSSWSGTKSLKLNILPPKPTISSLSKNGTGFTVKWKAVSGVGGYQIRYSTASNFSPKKTASVTGASKTSWSKKNLVKGQTYYVSVRSYKVAADGTKYYSKWSVAKSIVIK